MCILSLWENEIMKKKENGIGKKNTYIDKTCPVHSIEVQS